MGSTSTCKLGLGCVIVGTLLLAVALSETSTIGKCGSVYTAPQNIIWLTMNSEDCTDGLPCGYNIEAPLTSVVRLNFTRLSGLSSTESKTESNTYDLINGESNCQPRIEVTETYHTKEEVPVTQRKTLCYDRIVGSSVVIETQSNVVQLAVYCLASKYSFFSMNFAFIQKSDMCGSLQCNGQCLLASQVCNGVRDCLSGEDEMNCGITEPMKSSLSAPLDKTNNNVVIIVVLAAIAAMALLIMSVVCIYQRRCNSRNFPNTERASSTSCVSIAWNGEETGPEINVTLEGHEMQTQKLLQQQQTTHHERNIQAATSTATTAAQQTAPQASSSSDSVTVSSATAASNILTNANQTSLNGSFPVRPGYQHDLPYKQYHQQLSEIRQCQNKWNREMGQGLPRNIQLVPRDHCSLTATARNPSSPPAYQAECDFVTGAYSNYQRRQPHSCALQFTLGSRGSNDDHRRQSVVSYASHKSEPPSYEMATNPEYRVGGVCLSPPEVNSPTTRACPLCQQSL